MTRSNPEDVQVCRTCRHYFVTYEARWPHGCRAFDVKSRRLPCFEVEETSGAYCRGWEGKRLGRAGAERRGRPRP